MTDLLEIRGLTKRFDGRLVLGPLYFAVEAGETVAVLGPGGSGKSTFLRLIAGLEPADAGTVTLCGQPIRPQEVAILGQGRPAPWLSVADDAGPGAAATKLPSPPSGGAAERAVLARALTRALAARPQLLLLDEPFNAAAPLNRTGLQNHLAEVREHSRPTILLVPHDIDEALLLADRIIVLDGPPGRIVAEFAPRLPAGIKRSAPAFRRWKDRLIGVLGPAEALPRVAITKFEEHRHAV